MFFLLNNSFRRIFFALLKILVFYFFSLGLYTLEERRVLYKDCQIYEGQFLYSRNDYGMQGKGTMYFDDGRKFEGNWYKNYPVDGYLYSRKGEKVFITYAWNRKESLEGRLFKAKISFEDKSYFRGDVDNQYNPVEGDFYDKSGKKIPRSTSKLIYSDFFQESYYFENYDPKNNTCNNQVQKDNAKKKEKEKIKESPFKDKEEILMVSSGTGFAINSIGHVISNNHVVEGCQEVNVHHKGDKYLAKIIAKDKINDLALLKIDYKPEYFFLPSKENPDILEDIYVAGFPFGKNLSSNVKATKGIVSSLSGIEDNYSQFQIDAALQPGNSGGPIIDEEGNLIGVAVAKLDTGYAVEMFDAVPENVNFGVKSSLVVNLLSSNSIKLENSRSSRYGFNFSQNKTISSQIKEGTFYLSCWMSESSYEDYKERKVMFRDLN